MIALKYVKYIWPLRFKIFRSIKTHEGVWLQQHYMGFHMENMNRSVERSLFQRFDIVVYLLLNYIEPTISSSLSNSFSSLSISFIISLNSSSKPMFGMSFMRAILPLILTLLIFSTGTPFARSSNALS